MPSCTTTTQNDRIWDTATWGVARSKPLLNSAANCQLRRLSVQNLVGKVIRKLQIWWWITIYWVCKKLSH